MNWTEPAPCLFLFDVDHTLEISSGPISLRQLQVLRDQGHIIGICGNWGFFTQQVSRWQDLVSILGPIGCAKHVMLQELSREIGGLNAYVLVGNNEPGRSEDGWSAAEAGWRFVKEDAFSMEVCA